MSQDSYSKDASDAGDAADFTARPLGKEIARLLKTQVIVINRPGAGGAVGTNSV